MTDLTRKALRALLTDKCEDCAGTGAWGHDTCPGCGGRGWLPKESVVEQLCNIDLGMTHLFKDEARNLIIDWLEAEE